MTFATESELSDMRAAYLAAEKAGDDEAADALYATYVKARSVKRLAERNAANKPTGQTWGQMIGLPDHD